MECFVHNPTEMYDIYKEFKSYRDNFVSETNNNKNSNAYECWVDTEGHFYLL